VKSIRPTSDPRAIGETPHTARESGSSVSRLRGRRAAVLLFSYYPSDARPRRAAEALADEGMQVELICLRQSAVDPRRETCRGVEITRVPVRRHRGGAVTYLLQYSAFIVGSLGLLAARSVTRRFDLVHVHNMPDLLVFSALVPKLLGAKVILDLHDPMPELMMTIFRLSPRSASVRLLERLERWSVGFADAVFTVNRACERIFASRSCRADKIHVIMNTPDEAFFTFRPPARPQRSDRFVMMYHGSILERNGLDLAVEALATVRRSIPGAELRIYGEATPFLDRVMDAVRKHGVQDAVHYFGGHPVEAIVTAIDECDVGIIPNRRSIFTEINTPVRIFEYLSRGKPVITGRAIGVQDYFDDDALFFFELGDPSDLARVMVHVFRHPEDVEHVVERGQAVYAKHRWSAERRALIRTAEHLTGVASNDGDRRG
jgi:glycosyltransferase involved in cell wall biosynthesis